MKFSEERRAQSVKRVSLTTLVDICTQEGELPPFQGQSANVSGRGMNIRTSYLPEVGEELVCRLNHDDQEILVEGRVAWRAEGEDSGEFGIQFTALDADSAHLLRGLGDRPSEKEAEEEALEEESEGEGRLEFASEGARVKLHIDGLGAPMKACVHEGSSRKLKVGSCLEFLKVGRELEVEAVEGGGKRGAHVDSVNVIINPATAVPELVVQLRYEGVTPTPAPAGGVDYDDEAFSGAAGQDAESGLDEEDPAPWEPAAEAMRARLGGAMRSASLVAHKAGGVLSTVAQRAQKSLEQVKGPAKTQVKKATFSAHPPTKRRQTSHPSRRSAPSHLRSGIHDLGLASPSARARRSEPMPVKRSVRRAPAAAIFGLLFVAFGGSAFALRAMDDGAQPKKIVSEQLQPQAEVKIAEKSATVPQAPKPQAKVTDTASVVAEVPLFGPQAMALSAVKPAVPEESEVEIEKRSAAAAVQDESWDAPKAEVEKDAGAPWGKGKLYLPTIHRVRLDGVGKTLAGAANADGFTVVVPGRKAMESGKSIEKRDKRIVSVSANNNTGGATVKFEFRGPVPPYRVRLRQDFIEFLISAPEASF